MAGTELTPTQLEQFENEGWFVLRNMFDQTKCERMVAEIDEAQFRLELGNHAGGELEYRPMMHLLSPMLEAVASDERWAPVVQPLVGDDCGAPLYWEQAVDKPPHAHTELPWHQGNGCTWVVPGSHRPGTVDHDNEGGVYEWLSEFTGELPAPVTARPAGSTSLPMAGPASATCPSARPSTRQDVATPPR